MSLPTIEQEKPKLEKGGKIIFANCIITSANNLKYIRKLENIFFMQSQTNLAHMP
jgi:hypothetical protein